MMKISFSNDFLAALAARALRRSGYRVARRYLTLIIDTPDDVGVILEIVVEALHGVNAGDDKFQVENV